MINRTMEKQLKVVYLGEVKSLYGDTEIGIGFRTYITTVEKAIEIVQHKGVISEEALGLIPDNDLTPEGRFISGRNFPHFRDVIVPNVDLVIVSSRIMQRPHMLSAMACLGWITPELLPESCTVVLKMPFTNDEILTYCDEILPDCDDAQTILELMRTCTMDTIVEYSMIRSRQKKRNIYNRSVFIIGLKKVGGVDPKKSIPLLRSHLLQDTVTVTDQLIQPIKETASAGVSLFKWGQSFTSWVSRLVRAN